jgi:cytochrome c-type biogenesis protein
MNLVNIPIALGAGLLSITSPCCLPLLPGYVGYLTGMSSTELGDSRRRPFMAAVLFVVGFTIVFAALGATASALGHALLVHRQLFTVIAGAFILAMGLVVLLEGRVPFLARSGTWGGGWGRGRLWAAAPLGAAFAITWTPCIGPVLGGILALAGTTGSVGEGIFLLVVYSVGLGLPFVALSLSVPRMRARLQRVGRWMATVRVASGAVFVAMGVLLITGLWFPLMAPLLRFYAQAQWPPT